MFSLLKGNITRPTCFKQIRLYQTRDVRVRFAPSPTGYLHLGGLRTALYNYLFSKSNNGKFILRIEDTDQSRTIEGASNQLQRDLNWVGIYIDEGPNIGGLYGSYIQSQRINIYREQVHKLLKNGSAYYCFCTNRRLELLRLEAVRVRQIPKYDNKCRHLTKDEIESKLDHNDQFCIRFKLADGNQSFKDIIYGTVSCDIALNEGDPVIIKSDGFPTYHFANVVDDHFMHITHVLRGVEWQVSTPKHLMIYRAFNWNPPTYGHLPLLLNSDGSKLSKREGDIQISSYKQKGILPNALINFITYSGGGFEKAQIRGLKPKSYTINELAQQFDVTKINSHSGKLMLERLLEFNHLELERQINSGEELDILVIKIQNLIKKKFPDRITDNSLQLDEEYIKSILKWAINRVNCLNDLVSNELAFLWICPSKQLEMDKEHINVIKKLNQELQIQDDLQRDALKIFLKNFSTQNNIKFSNLMKIVRSTLSGLKEGPSVADMIEILGKENTLLRLQTYIDNYNG